MGRPFETEIQRVRETVIWSLDQDVQDLKNIILEHCDKPFYIVGSGGSFSACVYAAELLQFHGFLAKAITPLSLHQNRIRIHKSNLIFISASGKNTDIISSFENALSQDPNLAISITLRLNSPLKKLSDRFSVAKHFEYDLPTGKDGFLATNSLVSFFTLLNKAISANKNQEPNLDLIPLNEIETFAKKNANRKSFIVLYGGWSYSVAVDLESKFSEAALGNVLLSDYRNFGHGRHHWFDKQGKESVIILLSTPSEERLAEKTVSLLPKSIPHLKLFIDDISSNACISLLVQSFYFVNAIGKVKNIDPGRPGVPDYGSKLYNLRYKSLVKTYNRFPKKNHLAISRKVDCIELLNQEDLEIWNLAAEKFLNSLSSTRFGGIVFDYDGTLCSTEDRYTGMSPEVTRAMIEILEKGFIIGIATGRGKSVREDFQKQIPSKYWGQVIIAYYNGSDIGMLSDSTLPDTKTPPHPALSLIADSIANHPLLGKKLKAEQRPFQLTIKITDTVEWKYAKRILTHLLATLNLSDVQMLESSHSCDIIVASKASKLNILSYCRDMAIQNKFPSEFLCIGDRGQWPGNDFELLSHKFSISVDEVSPDINSCWNFAEAGKRNTAATLDYLSKIQWSQRDKSFSLQL